MLTIDMILAMSEDELRACTLRDLSECLMTAEVRLGNASADFSEAESTGTAVDEIYDFEVQTDPFGNPMLTDPHRYCMFCGNTDLKWKRGAWGTERWECEPCEERIYQSGF